MDETKFHSFPTLRQGLAARNLAPDPEPWVRVQVISPYLTGEIRS